MKFPLDVQGKAPPWPQTGRSTIHIVDADGKSVAEAIPTMDYVRATELAWAANCGWAARERGHSKLEAAPGGTGGIECHDCRMFWTNWHSIMDAPSCGELRKQRGVAETKKGQRRKGQRRS